MKWFFRTIFGYRVMVATIGKDIHFEHRPFRKPKIRITKSKINGITFDAVTFDELGATP